MNLTVNVIDLFVEYYGDDIFEEVYEEYDEIFEMKSYELKEICKEKAKEYLEDFSKDLEEVSGLYNSVLIKELSYRFLDEIEKDMSKLTVALYSDIRGRF